MPPTSDPTSLTLLARVQQSRPDAWERLVELYGPLVHYWCRQRDLSSEDISDVFQEVFRSVAENIASFRRDRIGDSFRGWLRTITRNKIYDHFRRERDKPAAQGGTVSQQQIQALEDPLSEDDEAQEQGVMTASLNRALKWIEGDFETKTWRAFWMCQIEELPTDQIAAELGMTPAAVRKSKYRVLRRLREELEGLMD